MQHYCIYICIMKYSKTTLKLDNAGMIASTLCAIHCALVPFAVTTLPLWGLEFLSDPLTEIIMLGIALILGFSSLSVSYFKNLL